MPTTPDSKTFGSGQEKLDWVSPNILELDASDTEGKANNTPEAYTAGGGLDNRFGPS